MSDAHDANSKLHGVLAAARIQWKLRPEDIGEVQFEQPRRKEAGYSHSAVDLFLSDLVTRFDGFVQDVEASLAPISLEPAPTPTPAPTTAPIAPEPVDETHTVGARMLRAQELIDQLITEAEERARSIVTAAEERAREIDARAASVEEDTRQRAEQMFGVEAERWVRRINQLEEAYRALRGTVESTCYSILDDFESDGLEAGESTRRAHRSLSLVGPTPALLRGTEETAEAPTGSETATPTEQANDGPDEVTTTAANGPSPMAADALIADVRSGEAFDEVADDQSPSAQGLAQIDGGAQDEASAVEDATDYRETDEDRTIATAIPAPAPGSGQSLMQILGINGGDGAEDAGEPDPAPASATPRAEHALG